MFVVYVGNRLEGLGDKIDSKAKSDGKCRNRLGLIIESSYGAHAFNKPSILLQKLWDLRHLEIVCGALKEAAAWWRNK